MIKREPILIPRNLNESKKPYGYVYITTCLVNHHQYIGRHCHNSFDEDYYGSGTGIKRAIKKYGKENFICEVLEWCNNSKVLNEREIFWIDLTGAKCGKTWYNYLSGGNGYVTEDVKGKQLDDVTRKKMSISHTGSKHSKEIKEKQSQALKKHNPMNNINSREKMIKTIKIKYKNGYVNPALGKTYNKNSSIVLSKLGKNNPNYGNALGTLRNEPLYGSENPNSKPVLSLNSYGKIVKIYSYMKEAKQDGFDSAGVRNSIITGKPYKGLYWKRCEKNDT